MKTNDDLKLNRNTERERVRKKRRINNNKKSHLQTSRRWREYGGFEIGIAANMHMHINDLQISVGKSHHYMRILRCIHVHRHQMWTMA